MTDDTHDTPLRLLAAFYEAFPERTPDWTLQAPERDMWIAACLSTNDVLTVYASDYGVRVSFTWRTAKNKRTIINRPLPRWARYVSGALLALSDSGIQVPGMEAVILGDEPEGPRYELALGMAFAALAHQIHARPYTASTLLEMIDRVRRDYVDAG